MSDLSICDGCNVLGAHEHACHGYNSVIGGNRTTKVCECPDCRDTDWRFPNTARVRAKDNPQPEPRDLVAGRSSIGQNRTATYYSQKNH